jgi:hypothetical protein
MTPKKRSLTAQLTLSLLTTLGVLCLVVLDEERTFMWLLARLLGACMAWLGYSTFLWVQEKHWWNDFFTWGILGEAIVILVDRSFLGWFPPLWPILWLSGPALCLCFAGGVREITKDYKWEERKALGIALGGGILLHYILVQGLVAAFFTLLMGSYP